MNSIVVYAIRFDEGAIYIGITSDLPRRLEEHKRRQSPSTRRYKGNFKLIYKSSFPDYPQARKYEKYLKSGAGRKMLKKTLE